MKKMNTLVVGIFFVFILNTSAFAENNVTIVASKSQFSEMTTLLKELSDENVVIKKVFPEDLSSATSDDYLIIVTTSNDPTTNLMADKLSVSDKERISKPNGMKFILLRDPWKPKQEVVVFAGNTENDASLLRKKTWGNWWATVASWFDINTTIVPNY